MTSDAIFPVKLDIPNVEIIEVKVNRNGGSGSESSGQVSEENLGSLGFSVVCNQLIIQKIFFCPRDPGKPFGTGDSR